MNFIVWMSIRSYASLHLTFLTKVFNTFCILCIATNPLAIVIARFSYFCLRFSEILKDEDCLSAEFGGFGAHRIHSSTVICNTSGGTSTSRRKEKDRWSKWTCSSASSAEPFESESALSILLFWKRTTWVSVNFTLLHCSDSKSSAGNRVEHVHWDIYVFLVFLVLVLSLQIRACCNVL